MLFLREAPKDLEKVADKLKELIRVGELEELEKSVKTWIFLERHLYHFITNIVEDDPKSIEELEKKLREKFGKRINWIRVKRAVDYLVNHKYLEKTFGHRGSELKTLYLTLKSYPIIPPEDLVTPEAKVLASIPMSSPEPRSLGSLGMKKEEEKSLESSKLDKMLKETDKKGVKPKIEQNTISKPKKITSSKLNSSVSKISEKKIQQDKSKPPKKSGTIKLKPRSSSTSSRVNYPFGWAPVIPKPRIKDEKTSKESKNFEKKKENSAKKTKKKKLGWH